VSGLKNVTFKHATATKSSDVGFYKTSIDKAYINPINIMKKIIFFKSNLFYIAITINAELLLLARLTI
jgi:hypothetical protein